MQNFIHLRCHTNYSVGEGCLDISTIVKLCEQNNFPAIGICDTGNMFGAREFSYKLVGAGIQPIIGFQIDTFVSHNNKRIEGSLVFLAKNDLGYKNLLKIHDKAYQYKSKNNLDSVILPLDDILQYASEVICLSGGINGFLASCIAHGIEDNIIKTLINSYKEDLYIEINRFFDKKDKILEPKFLNLAKNYNVPIVATNDVIFGLKKDYESADILCCIGQGVNQREQNRKVAIVEAYFKSSQEMCELFKDLPEAIENTINIAKKCCFYVEKKSLSLPEFGEDEVNLIKVEANNGLQDRLKNEVYLRHKLENINKSEIQISKEYQDRLDFELDVIIKMGFCGYFLIVSDFIKWSKEHDIPVGPGRGSGAGSLVAWCLKITDVDPIQFSLLFERFLNPERISMPDFDIDFCQDGRERVIQYVRDKYGEDKVAHIITFGTLQTKAALKDVGRAMGLPYNEVDGITKKIPHSNPLNHMSISRLMTEQGAVKDEIDDKEHIKHLFEVALKLEGLYRNISTHAAGVVISKNPLNEVAPLFYDAGLTLPSVGFSMKYIEDVGLVKFDFLGLKTLSIIADAVKIIKKQNNLDLDMLNIPYKDDEISKLLSSGDTLGVFQLESRGMTEVIKQLHPDRIEDIIAIISLYRPGPMENIPLYIDNKNNADKLVYQHHKMEPILKETFGIMIYQEQVMQVAQVIGGYTLGGADILRRAMGKKDPVEMEKQRKIFCDGALANNEDITEQLAGEIFDQMEKFAGYGFNKSHATAYALISWQTAYLKTYYPAEFLAASMSADIGANNKEQEKFLEYIEEAKRYNIPILPPSLNNPSTKFEIEIDEHGNKTIRYSLLSLKGVGEAFVLELIREVKANGKFKNLEDFLSRVDSKLLNKKPLESMTKAGAMSEVHANRKELIENLEYLLSYNSNVFEDKNSNQIGLFDNVADTSKNILNLNPCTDWTDQEKRVEELDVLGYFLSGHPLVEYDDILKAQKVKSYAELLEKQLSNAFLAGYLMKIKVSKSKNGSTFGNLTFYDKSSVFSIVLFGDNFNKYKDSLEQGKNYIVKVATKVDGDDFRVFIESIDNLNHSYKIKNTNSSFEKKEVYIPKGTSLSKASHVHLTITLDSPKGLESLVSLIKNKSASDTALIKIYNGHEYLTFHLQGVMIISSEIEKIRYNPHVLEIKNTY